MCMERINEIVYPNHVYSPNTFSLLHGISWLQDSCGSLFMPFFIRTVRTFCPRSILRIECIISFRPFYRKWATQLRTAVSFRPFFWVATFLLFSLFPLVLFPTNRMSKRGKNSFSTLKIRKNRGNPLITRVFRTGIPFANSRAAFWDIIPLVKVIGLSD